MESYRSSYKLSHRSSSQFRLEDVYYNPIYGIPTEKKLINAYNAYEVSNATKNLTSEANRTVQAESYIKNANLGPLSDECVRAIAKKYGPGELMPIITNDPHKLRIYYDALSVNWPLEECYFVTDEIYWRRVVLTKSTDKSLEYKTDYNWKPLAISLRFVEWLESCSAEYIPERIKVLSPLIKEYITELKIRHLQPLQEFSFAPHFRHSDTESTNDTESSDSSNLSVKISGESIQTGLEDNSEEKNEGVDEPTVQKIEKELECESKEAERELARTEERVALKNAKHRRHEVREVRRKHRINMRAQSLLPPATPPPPPRKKKPKKKPKNKSKKKVDESGVFDIVIPPEDDDSDMNIPDRRNLDKLLYKRRNYKYPPQHCHHVNLSFLSLFVNLTLLHIEFLGPEGMKFENRHFNFSYIDMKNLAFALFFLGKLKVFRLRNSRMDCRKVHILVQPLQYFPELETVDFGYDTLNDDCGGAFYKLLQNPNIKSLELEGNFISINVLTQIADALHKFSAKFEYLGLAHNPLGDKALHVLSEAIIGTEQLTHLCISGAFITQEAIACCIANEMLRHHPILIHLNIQSLHIGLQAATEIIKALQSNFTILNLDCRGCDLPYDIEFDINVVLERNRFITQTPFVGVESTTVEEVTEFVNKIKNPIMLKAINAVKKQNDCLKARPDKLSSSIIFSEEQEEETTGTVNPLERSESTDSMDRIELNSTFIYDPNKFNLKQFERHVYTYGRAKLRPVK